MDAEQRAALWARQRAQQGAPTPAPAKGKGCKRPPHPRLTRYGVFSLYTTGAELHIGSKLFLPELDKQGLTNKRKTAEHAARRYLATQPGGTRVWVVTVFIEHKRTGAVNSYIGDRWPHPAPPGVLPPPHRAAAAPGGPVPALPAPQGYPAMPQPR